MALVLSPRQVLGDTPRPGQIRLKRTPAMSLTVKLLQKPHKQQTIQSASCSAESGYKASHPSDDRKHLDQGPVHVRRATVSALCSLHPLYAPARTLRQLG